MRIKVDGNDFSRIDGRGRPTEAVCRMIEQNNRAIPKEVRERLEKLNAIQQRKESHKHNK